DSGAADHEFRFTNNSSRTIRIISVEASCGCTTPGWSTDPIPNGKEGFVKVSYNPKGRPGYFNKSLTVTTDFDGSPVTLQIKGQVVNAKTLSARGELPVENGNLKLKSNSFNLGKVFINQEPTTVEFVVLNTGARPIKFTNVIGPSYIKSQVPDSLGVNESGLIKLTYDAAARNQYGFVSDNIQIQTDDESVPLKSFPVYTSIEEFFLPMSANELSKAPVLYLESSVVDFARLMQGVVGEQEIALKNNGKNDLLIRSLQPNCSCVTASVEQMRVKAGAETKLIITFSTEGRKNTQQKSLTIYSNDPQNPVQRITLMAYIE
ncbi:MAG: DUF1573 domain-containing protein, partial [Bacteroidia bacterium]|nr:DUF1573 domain-containing protein [Bacteroidia bacterium]